MKPNHMGRVEKHFFFKSKHHDLAIGSVSYFEILGVYTLTNSLEDPTTGFVIE